MALRLRAVIALDEEEIDRRVRLPELDVYLVIRRVVAGERGRVVGEFDDHDARAGCAFRVLELACALHEARAELLEDAGIGGRIGLVALVAVHVDAAAPVALCHVSSPTCPWPVLFPRRSRPPPHSGRAHRRPAGRTPGAPPASRGRPLPLCLSSPRPFLSSRAPPLPRAWRAPAAASSGT